MVLSSRVAAKYRGLSEGEGALPRCLRTTPPPRNPFIMVPVTLRNRSVTVRVDGDDVTVRVLTVKGASLYRHSVTAVTHRHASLAISFKLMLRPA